MTKEVSRTKLAEYVARRMLSDIEDHGGVDEFCQKLRSFPEQYLSDLAIGAVDCIGLVGCLHTRVVLP